MKDERMKKTLARSVSEGSSIQHRAQPATANQPMITGQTENRRHDKHDSELDRCRSVHLCEHDLHDADNGQMAEISPVGSIRQIAQGRLFTIEEAQEQPEEAKHRKPGEQGAGNSQGNSPRETEAGVKILL